MDERVRKLREEFEDGDCMVVAVFKGIGARPDPPLEVVKRNFLTDKGIEQLSEVVVSQSNILGEDVKKTVEESVMTGTMNLSGGWMWLLLVMYFLVFASLLKYLLL